MTRGYYHNGAIAPRCSATYAASENHVTTARKKVNCICWEERCEAERWFILKKLGIPSMTVLKRASSMNHVFRTKSMRMGPSAVSICCVAFRTLCPFIAPSTSGSFFVFGRYSSVVVKLSKCSFGHIPFILRGRHKWLFPLENWGLMVAAPRAEEIE